MKPKQKGDDLIDEVNVKDVDGATPLGLCPTCGMSVYATLDPPAVMHGVPTCSDYDRRNALAFVTWMRQKGAS